jgi:hypothetical protein
MILRLAGLAAAVSVIVATCGVPNVREDVALEGRLKEVPSRTSPVPLADLATYEWDLVYLFEGYTTGDEVDSTVGGHVPMNGLGWVPESETLAVFDLNGKPVVFAEVASRFLNVADRSLLGYGYSRDVVVESCDGRLLVHEPGQNSGLENC